jgi:hypothetical protein
MDNPDATIFKYVQQLIEPFPSSQRLERIKRVFEPTYTYVHSMDFESIRNTIVFSRIVYAEKMNVPEKVEVDNRLVARKKSIAFESCYSFFFLLLSIV